jgi:hypothetical protein
MIVEIEIGYILNILTNDGSRIFSIAINEAKEAMACIPQLLKRIKVEIVITLPLAITELVISM